VKKISVFIIVLSTAALVAANNALAASRRVTPSDNWCSIVNNSVPGDEIIFAPGNYPNTCWITVSGTASNPILIRSESETNRATFNYSGSSSNILEIRGSYITIRGFGFRPSSDVVDSVRIMVVSNVTVENNRFEGIGNIAVSANSGNSSNLTIRNNTFLNLLNTPVYIGVHDGSVSSRNLLFEGNFINGVSPPDPSIGYGIEVKLNSYGTIRDNTIYNTKGPPIMTYGSNKGDPASIIEGNYAEGSRNEGGIVIGGGPAIVKNNVLVGNGYGGISCQNYGGRGLQKNIWLIHNTILNNDDSGINVSGWTTGANNVIAYNVILPLSGTPALRPSTPIATLQGNITCSGASACFVNGSSAPYDLWPAVSSPLLDAAGSGSEPWRPVDDFMGIDRGSLADIGAFERVAQTFNHLVGAGNARPSRVTISTLKGDVNQDNSIDVLDVQALVNHILGIQSYGASADVNIDGSIDVLDVQEVVNIILG
jgi:hypothetical protein